MEKQFISAGDLLRDSFALGQNIYDSGFRPTFIIGVWRGGTPVGIAVQELLERLGCEADHYAIRTSSYGKSTKQTKSVKVYGLRHIAEIIKADDRLLLIDDVFDSGRSVAAILGELQTLTRRNMPEDVKVATVYYKPSKNKTTRTPDYYIHKSENWLVFPHELHGLTKEELRAHKGLPSGFFEKI